MSTLWALLAPLGLLFSGHWLRSDTISPYFINQEQHWRALALELFKERAPQQELRDTLKVTYGQLPEVLLDLYPSQIPSFHETSHAWALIYAEEQEKAPDWSYIGSEIRWMLTWGSRGPEYFISEVEAPQTLQRVNHFPYLPETLPPGQTLFIPIHTDISDSAFLEEFKIAVDLHWNDSSWAQQKGVRFEIQFLPFKAYSDPEFDLDRNIQRFPSGSAALTTGARSPFTRGNVIVLGPGKIPRATLAHEFGHVLGFEDCYFRKREADPFFGVVLTEWVPKHLEHELMCDSLYGKVKAIAW